MLREDAISEMEYYEGIEECSFRVSIINKIYDTFESRICDNCKYLNTELISDTILCDKTVSSHNSTWKSEVHKSFGCNKWQGKETHVKQ